MAKERWTHSNTTIYNIGYHIIWCPKYRRKVLQSPVSDRLEVLLREKADELGVVIETMEIMPDHLHLFVKAKPTASPHWIVQQLKGYTETKPFIQIRLAQLVILSTTTVRRIQSQAAWRPCSLH